MPVLRTRVRKTRDGVTPPSHRWLEAEDGVGRRLVHGYAVELFFDAATRTAIERVWRMFDRLDPAKPLIQRGASPHISLTIHPAIDLPAARAELRSLARRTPVFPVRFSSLGMFFRPQNVLHLVPVMSGQLWRLHCECVERFSPIIGDPHPLYAPGQWVPHCTLAMEFDDALWGPLLTIAKDIELPFEGVCEAISIVEFRPVRQISRFALRK